MPIYEYKCDNGHVFDVMQRMSDDTLTSCVECGAPVRKILHPINIAFKGSGFYSTDYNKKAAKSETSSSNGDSKEKKSDTSDKSSSSSTDKKAPSKKD